MDFLDLSLASYGDLLERQEQFPELSLVLELCKISTAFCKFWWDEQSSGDERRVDAWSERKLKFFMLTCIFHMFVCLYKYVSLLSSQTHLARGLDLH